MSGNALQNENLREDLPKVFLLTPGETCGKALSEAEEALDMIRRGLTYAAEKDIRMVSWSTRNLCENKVNCEVVRGRKTSVSITGGCTLFDEPKIIKVCLSYGRNAIPVSDPDRFMRCLSGFAHIIANHLQKEEVDLHFPFTEMDYETSEATRRPFEVHTRNHNGPVDHDELPKELVEFLGSPKFPNMLVSGNPAGAWNPTFSIQPLRGTAKKGDPLELMSKIKLAHEALERGSESFDPS